MWKKVICLWVLSLLIALPSYAKSEIEYLYDFEKAEKKSKDAAESAIRWKKSADISPELKKEALRLENVAKMEREAFSLQLKSIADNVMMDRSLTPDAVVRLLGKFVQSRGLSQAQMLDLLGNLESSPHSKTTAKDEIEFYLRFALPDQDKLKMCYANSQPDAIGSLLRQVRALQYPDDRSFPQQKFQLAQAGQNEPLQTLCGDMVSKISENAAKDPDRMALTSLLKEELKAQSSR